MKLMNLKKLRFKIFSDEPQTGKLKIKGEKADKKFCADGYCMLEAGEDLAGFAYGDFFGEPHPQIHLKMIGKKWHIGKVLFEKWWLSPVGLKKVFYKNLLQSGGKLIGIPVKL